MLGNGVEMSLIFPQILGSLVLGWAPNHFVLGTQLAPGEKRLVCITGNNNLRKTVIIFLSISLNMCFGCSKEPSHETVF